MQTFARGLGSIAPARALRRSGASALGRARSEGSIAGPDRALITLSLFGRSTGHFANNYRGLVRTGQRRPWCSPPPMAAHGQRRTCLRQQPAVIRSLSRDVLVEPGSGERLVVEKAAGGRRVRHRGALRDQRRAVE